MRLIDADVLIKKLKSNSWDIDEWELPHEQVSAGLMANAYDSETVKKMPTVDAEPVKHGRWIDPAAENCYRCSICEEYTTLEIPRLFYHYCPNCGARMRDE